MEWLIPMTLELQAILLHLNKNWKEYFLNELINRKLLFLDFILDFITIL